MKKIVPISLFSQYTPYLCEWSEGHLCRATIDYIRSSDSDDAIGYALHLSEGPVSISIASKIWPYAVIATHPAHRGFGYAEKVLRQTINHFSLMDKTYSTWVASDNTSSVSLLERCGLRRVAQEVKTRESTGRYIAYRYSSK
jgi:GNAT superfamily N-acetyltransferase